MAVVQISRIQIRRGQRNSGTGLPQLASGEMAWAVDTQELFIGNGSVSEGAPAVGNTKIITSKDLASESNLFGAVQYVYKSNENITVQNNAPITRTLQERLDDIVNTTDFGTVGNYDLTNFQGADDTNALQFAINQLFLNASSKASSTGAASVSSRIILEIPAGTYRLRSTLYVPSYASLIGAGADKTFIFYDPPTTAVSGTITQDAGNTVILSSQFTMDMVGAYITGTNITDTNTTIVSVVAGIQAIVSHNLSSATNASFTIIPKKPAIQFVNDYSIIGTPSSIDSTDGITQPRNIQLSGLTIHDNTGVNTCLQVDAVKNSLFEDLSLVGSPDGSYHSFAASSRGISLNVHSTLVTTENNIFRNINFTGFSNCVYAMQDSVNNMFDECYLTDSLQGFVMGVGADGVTNGQLYGPRQTQIINSKFYNIKWQGVYCARGEFNTVSGCSFFNVGVDGTSNTHSGTDIVRYPQIYFGTHGNLATNIKSDRSDDMEGSNFGIVYAPVVTGHGVSKSNSTSTIYLGNTAGDFLRLPTPTDAFGIPGGSMMYNIEYVFQNNASGTKYTRVGTMIVAVDVDNNQVQFSDEYNFAGTDTNIDDMAVRLDFSAVLMDINGNPATTNGSAYSILISYTNSTFALSGYFVYSYTAIM